MSKFLELAERWKKATEPDRQLDADTAIATGWVHKCNTELWGIGAPHWYKNGKSASEIIGWWFNGPNGHQTSLPYFTASMDAVMTLIPDGCVWGLMTDYDLEGRARISNVNLVLKNIIPRSDGRSPVLAMGAACMIAHHSLRKDSAS